VVKAPKLEGPAHPTLVLIVWEDAHSQGIELVTKDDLAHRPEVMQTVGWVIKESDNGKSIASERCSDAGVDYYRGHTFIPKSLIRSVTPLNVSRPRRKKESPDA
jgi:hypothetical protein